MHLVNSETLFYFSFEISSHLIWLSKKLHVIAFSRDRTLVKLTDQPRFYEPDKQLSTWLWWWRPLRLSTITDNSPLPAYPHLDDHTTRSTVTPEFNLSIVSNPKDAAYKHSPNFEQVNQYLPLLWKKRTNKSWEAPRTSPHTFCFLKMKLFLGSWRMKVGLHQNQKGVLHRPVSKTRIYMYLSYPISKFITLVEISPRRQLCCILFQNVLPAL